jgi:beta-phosphoglucomutase-like phosphatase (HAD superfamily)
MPKLPPLLVVFDLDETLIASSLEPLPQRPPDFWWAGHAIYLRPHVHALLVDRFERGAAAIWTASDPGYAFPILERILRGPLDPFQFVLTREHCQPGPDPEVPLKPLPTLLARGADPARTLMVDNRPKSFAGHEANGLAVRDYVGHEGDRELLALRDQLRAFDGLADVRRRGPESRDR